MAGCDKWLSEKLVERLEMMELVEESFIGGQPALQLTIVGALSKQKGGSRLTNPGAFTQRWRIPFGHRAGC